MITIYCGLYRTLTRGDSAVLRRRGRRNLPRHNFRVALYGTPLFPRRAFRRDRLRDAAIALEHAVSFQSVGRSYTRRPR